MFESTKHGKNPVFAICNNETSNVEFLQRLLSHPTVNINREGKIYNSYSVRTRGMNSHTVSST